MKRLKLLGDLFFLEMGLENPGPPGLLQPAGVRERLLLVRFD